MAELYRIYAGVLGALIGSFLNVVIYRLPRGKGLALDRSHCPRCQGLIPWWHNVPIISWLVLRGKCARCGAPIKLQYLVVEVITATVFALSFPAEVTSSSVMYWAFLSSITCVLVCHFFIDLEHKLLLDVLNIYLLLVILPFSILFRSPVHWIAGGAFGLLAPLAVSWGFYKWKGKIGLGGGDIKLWGVLGLYLGIQGIIENIFLSCLLGSVVGIGLIIAKKYDRDGGIPFGPFIIVVTIFQMYLAEWVDLLSIF